MSKSFADEFYESRISDGKFALPSELIERFDIIECLSSNELGETYLLSEKNCDKRFVLKCYQKPDTENKVGETDFLNELNHKNLPKYVTALETKDYHYVLHEYVDGVSLSHYVDEHEKISEAQAVGVVLELCGVLSYLHSRPVPIIHRDIKPSNIIINPADNSITLIDFGISRKFSEKAETDTYNFGTKKYAPPEQYGFSQTDCRADIFALGVVLRFMLTGSADGEIQNKRLDGIIKKCVAFSPKDRYQSAEALRRVLIKYKKRTWQKAVRIAMSMGILFVMLAVGFTIGRYTEFLIPAVIEQPEADIFIFTEPLIEKAVRFMLDKTDDEPVLRSELDGVTEIYLVGKRIAQSQNETEIIRAAGSFINGTIEVLDDFRAMKNLRTLYLIGHLLTDVSPLADCTLLEAISLAHCPVTDVSPLTALTRLRTLDLYATEVSSFSCFADMKVLHFLSLANTPLVDISELEIPNNLFQLNLRSPQITELNGIERFSSLRLLQIVGTSIRDFSPLDSLPLLRTLTISPEMEQYLYTLNRDDIEIQIEQ